MEEVGVLAVVKELQSFLGDMNKVNSALNGLRPSGSMLQDMFGSIGEAVSNFGQKVWDVASVTLGVMLRDAIEGVISAVGELIGSIVEAGSDFQLLKIRLTGLNLNETADSTRNFADAMSEAKDMTKEELTWLQTLGSATPFDPKQITDTYTQARAFGFTSDAAKRLTQDIIDYTAGMGLSNQTMFLVIQNLGQMVQRGKITGTEIRDLARGSFLPLSDVLERIAKNMGITVKELTKRISTKEGVPAQEFVKAFEQMVEDEPRFVGAAGRMSRALVPAAQNVKELFTSVFGLNVVTPIFDVLGEKVASVVDQFAFFNEQGDLIKTQKWTDLVAAAQNLGQAISQVVGDILGLIPDAETLGDSLTAGVQGAAVWIGQHREEIVGFFRNIGTTIQNDVIPFIRDQLIPAIGSFGAWIIENKEGILQFFLYIGALIQYTAIILERYLIPAFDMIRQWINDNQELINQFFTSLGTMFAYVLSQLGGMGAQEKGASALQTILEIIKNFMQYVVDHTDQIQELVLAFIRVWAVVQLLIAVFNIIMPIFIFLASIVLTFITVVGTLVSIIGIASAVISAFGVPILVLISTIVLGKYYLGLFGLAFTEVKSAILSAIGMISTGLGLLQQNLVTTVLNIISSVRNQDWLGVGRAIIQGMINGVGAMVATLISAVVNAARSAYTAAQKYLHISSPSGLFSDLGEMTMKGMALGIENWAGLTGQAMTDAMTKMAVPAMTMPSIVQSVIAQAGGGNTVSNQSTRNYNLTVHSGASAEPIIQDFNMLASLSGV